MYFLSEDLFLPLQTVQTLMKCHIMGHSSGSSLFVRGPVERFSVYKRLDDVICSFRCSFTLLSMLTILLVQYQGIMELKLIRVGITMLK